MSRLGAPAIISGHPAADKGLTAKWQNVVPACEAPRMVVVFDAELWVWDARRSDTWTFVSLPAEASDDIRELSQGLRRGFGSLRVRAELGGSTWVTSIFPSAKDGPYVLPVKRAVRTKEGLDIGDTATVTIETVEV
jgi:hypothetical protein